MISSFDRGRRKARCPKLVTKVRSQPAAGAQGARRPRLIGMAVTAIRSAVARYSSRWRLVTTAAPALLSNPSTTDSTGRLSTLGRGTNSRSATVLAYSLRVSRRSRRGPGTSSPWQAAMAPVVGGAATGEGGPPGGSPAGGGGCRPRRAGSRALRRPPSPCRPGGAAPSDRCGTVASSRVVPPSHSIYCHVEETVSHGGSAQRLGSILILPCNALLTQRPRSTIIRSARCRETPSPRTTWSTDRSRARAA